MNTSQRRLAAQPIKWNLWLAAPKVELWQAVVLVMGINPDSLRRSPDEWTVGPTSSPMLERSSFPSLESHESFKEAYSHAARAASDEGPIHFIPTAGAPAVHLLEVVAFFVTCDWPNIPAPLLEAGKMGPPREDAAPAPAAVQGPSEDAAGLVSGADDATDVKPVARWRAQEKTILNKLRELDYSPCALPRNEAWKPGVKSKVRAAIGSNGMWHSPRVFDKAWERLRERGEIADKP